MHSYLVDEAGVRTHSVDLDGERTHSDEERGAESHVVAGLASVSNAALLGRSIERSSASSGLDSAFS